MAAGKAWVMFG